MRRTGRIIAIVSLAAAAAGCSSTTAPGIHPEINSVTDNFQFQTTAVTNYSGTLTYSWTNTGTAATVNQATVIAGGTMTLVLQDASGQQVYSRSLSDNGTFLSTAGTAGTWTVKVTFSGASGTVNFRAQKKT